MSYLFFAVRWQLLLTGPTYTTFHSQLAPPRQIPRQSDQQNKCDLDYERFFFFLFSLDLQDLGSFIFSEGEMRAALLLFQHMYLWLAIAVHIKKQQEADDCVWCTKSSSAHEVLWFNEAQVPPARSFLGKHPRMWKIGHMYREHVTTPATKSYIQIMFFFSITNPMPFAMCLCHFV